jgi:multiple sugar transport system substrate-binding protein
MQGWRKASALAALTAAIVSVAVTAGMASAHSTKTNAGTLNIMGFGKGDDVAESRAAIATQAVGGTVNRPSGSFNDQQFLAAVASGNVPDLVYLDRQKVGTYAAKGAFLPLTSCIKSQKINMKQYRQAAVNEVTYKGKVYGIPEFYDVRTILIDNDVLDQTKTPIGWLNPAKPDRLLAAAKKMYDSSGGKVTRIGFDPKIPEFFIMWAHADGVDLLSADGKTANLDDPKAVEALQYTMSLIDEQGGWNRFKSFRDTWDFFGAKNQVASDQVGAWPMESWYWNVMADNSPDVDVAAVPFTDRQGKPFTY